MAIRCEQQLENERGDAARETSAAPGRTICKTLAFNEPEALCQSSKLEELLMPAHHSSMKLKHGMYAITPPIAYITPCEASKAYTLFAKRRNYQGEGGNDQTEEHGGSPAVRPSLER